MQEAQQAKSMTRHASRGALLFAAAFISMLLALESQEHAAIANEEGPVAKLLAAAARPQDGGGRLLALYVYRPLSVDRPRPFDPSESRGRPWSEVVYLIDSGVDGSDPRLVWFERYRLQVKTFPHLTKSIAADLCWHEERKEVCITIALSGYNTTEVLVYLASTAGAGYYDGHQQIESAAAVERAPFARYMSPDAGTFGRPGQQRLVLLEDGRGLLVSSFSERMATFELDFETRQLVLRPISFQK